MGNTRLERELEELVKEKVRAKYEEKGHHADATKITVTRQDNITVVLNTESPFLADELFGFLDELKNELKETLKPYGFVYDATNSGFFHSYYSMRFEFLA